MLAAPSNEWLREAFFKRFRFSFSLPSVRPTAPDFPEVLSRSARFALGRLRSCKTIHSHLLSKFLPASDHLRILLIACLWLRGLNGHMGVSRLRQFDVRIFFEGVSIPGAAGQQNF